LSQGAAGGEAQVLELAYTLWAATSGLGDRLNWVRRTFDELILPATSVSFLV
jgi:hypothetical protein